jgi:hypothetical protein
MAIIPGSAKVLNQYENVNTTYGGSEAMKAQSKWYTMQDIEDTINASKPYKVFTALLTQSGVSNSINISSGTLTKGVSYQFSGAGGTDVDFSNVGVTNPVDGEFFIATQTAEPNNFDGWTVSYDSGAPVATVLENTIGNIWFTYIAVGSYQMVSDGLFPSNKTILMTPTTQEVEGPTDLYNTMISGPASNVFYISNFYNFVKVDNFFDKIPIEIRVYN